MSGAFHDAAQEGVAVDEADFVIVGSGAGGGAAARVLAEAGYSVVVLEDGPYVTKDKVSNIAFESMKTLLRYNGQMAAFGRATVPILQGRCVGGTTFVNSAIVWRMPGKVLAKWHKEHGLADGFPEADLDSAYSVIERDMSVRPVHDDVASGNDRAMEFASVKLGLESRPLHRYDKNCKGSARCLMGCPNDAKQSTTINYLRRATTANAHVVSNAKAVKVLVERGRATGVVAKVSSKGPRGGEKFTVRARRSVIVAGSVFGSPNLLRQSGIALQSEALGEHFQAHPGTGIGALYDRPINMWNGAAQGYETLGLRDTLGVKLESINVPPEVLGSRLPGIGKDYQRYLENLPNVGVWSLAIRAEAHGSVRPSRLFGDFVKYELTTVDLERVRDGVKKLAEMHFLAGAREVFPAIHGVPVKITSLDELKLIDQAKLDPQNFSMVATHLFGTARAGIDPKTSVVDPYLRVHGVEGLYVMDGSVFPTNTGVNPQHSIMAVATVAAKRLAANTLQVKPISELHKTPVREPEVAAVAQ
jgi:choline dehydrogenase-like flavoprotein